MFRLLEEKLVGTVAMPNHGLFAARHLPLASPLLRGEVGVPGALSLRSLPISKYKLAKASKKHFAARSTLDNVG
jgi:hypothetical protein